jgi:hypothetical protein
MSVPDEYEDSSLKNSVLWKGSKNQYDDFLENNSHSILILFRRDRSAYSCIANIFKKTAIHALWDPISEMQYSYSLDTDRGQIDSWIAKTNKIRQIFQEIVKLTSVYAYRYG